MSNQIKRHQGICYLKLRLTGAALAAALIAAPVMRAETFEPIKFGNFNNWITRNFKESHIIGGNQKTVYEIGPTATINGSIPYKNRGGSPWATSNVLAKVHGITKGSNAVFPDTRSGADKCAKLTTLMEHCKALGIINIDVLVAGSIFLGEMIEPIKGTSDPYSKMEMGIPYTKRPKALRFDYKLEMPDNPHLTYSSGFGSKKNKPGHDNAEVYVILQRRWEDKNGNLYAKRVGTARQRFSRTTSGWVNGHKLHIIYGDASHSSKAMPLIPASKSYYARNSKGKMVPVKEVGWDSPDAIPTHLMVMASAGSGEPYTGTIGLTLWVDNMGLVF